MPAPPSRSAIEGWWMACKASHSDAAGGCALPPSSGCRSAQSKHLLLANPAQRRMCSRPAAAQVVAHCGLQVCIPQASGPPALQRTLPPSCWLLHDMLPAILFSAQQQRLPGPADDACVCCRRCTAPLLLQALHSTPSLLERTLYPQHLSLVSSSCRRCTAATAPRCCAYCRTR